MTESTTNYDMFVFREDNRDKIDQGHVRKLVDSITSRNLLELRPIVVNERMEIIDGQHRLLAAQKLGVEIYYQVEENLDSEQIINLNIAKTWGIQDFLNFYVNHEYPEYVKLHNVIKKNNLPLKVAISLYMGQSHIGFHDFKIGKYVFKNETVN